MTKQEWQLSAKDLRLLIHSLFNDRGEITTIHHHSTYGVYIGLRQGKFYAVYGRDNNSYGYQIYNSKANNLIATIYNKGHNQDLVIQYRPKSYYAYILARVAQTVPTMRPKFTAPSTTRYLARQLNRLVNYDGLNTVNLKELAPDLRQTEASPNTTTTSETNNDVSWNIILDPETGSIISRS